MRSIVTHICNQKPINAIAGRLRRLRNARALAVMMVIALLITSLPASAGTTSHANAVTPYQRSFASQLYNDVGTTIGSIASWVRGYVRPQPAVASQPYIPVAAYLNPAPPFISQPTGLSVSSASATAISLSWTPPAGGADHYQVERSESVSGPFFFVGNASGATYNDTSVTNLHAYLYRVRAVSAVGAVSLASNMALGTAITFEFSVLANQIIKAQHYHDVRTAINKVRGVAGLSDYAWARGNLAGLTVNASDTNEMRSALDAALTPLSIPVTAYTDPTLTVSVMLIKATHLEQLQSRSTRGQSTSSGPADSDSSSARLNPMNETGGGSENPLSRNFNWNLPLLNLPGRAGLDLSLTLSYNSLVWTNIGSTAMWFDADNGFPGPGFRLGFPVIQPLYYNAEVGKNAFLLLGSDGRRTELRQVGASALYESADSAHMLLDSNTMIMSLTDGSQLTYELRGGEYKCAKIKDRNGNYISVSYNTAGRVNTITDTAGRVLTFNYDGNGWLTSITQQWNQTSTAVTHYWARFEYADKLIDTNFPGLTIFGPADNTNIKTLSRVKLADDSYFDFNYTSWGQVYKISSYAPDAHLLNYRFYNLPQTAGTGLEHSDCPRFTERRDWAQYWNGDTDGTTSSSEEALTTFAVPVSDTWTMPNNASASGVRAQVTAPDGTSNKIYFISSPGWQRGLTALVDTYASGNSTPVRRSMTTWTQDNTTVSYPLNPRVTATNVYDDANNRAHTEITYQQFTFSNGTSCQLPRDLYEYANDENPPNPATMLRSTRTVYNMTTTYTDRHILGLVSEKQLYEGNVNTTGVLNTKQGFLYDETGSIDATNTPVQHDSANYGASLVAGRGNTTSVKRYDVTNSNVITSTRLKYNRAGSIISSKDALDHEVTISYADSFSDGLNTRNTFAYPTIMTDPDGFSTTSKFNFDFGAATYRRTPQPNVTTNTPGPEQSTTFDALGRLERVTNLVNNAYTRFGYSTSHIRVDTYTTLQEGAGEAHALKITDGLGRVVATASDHPGSVGGFSGQKLVYNVMGRVIKTSNPTETSASGAPSQWNTAGDDASAGWIYTEQTYDWKGRPLITTNQDLTTKTASYSGCGCAGGDVVTVTDEGSIDASGATKKQQQKVYSDVLGRTVKTEIMNWSNGSVLSATVNTYNARDQLTRMRQYSGPEGSTTYQDTVVTYDGYGRVNTKHLPEQDTNALTTWAYNADDTVSVITDPRGATSTFAYDNQRGLVHTATYALSGKPTIVLTYAYDSVGNTTSVADPSGTTSYSYNSLSQLTSETRQFAGLSGQSFTMSYAYTLAGKIKTFTLPSQFGTTVNYQYDRASRLTSVTNNGYTYSDPTSIQTRVELPLPTFLTNISYRAWNDVKAMDDGQGVHLQYAYNSRLLPSTYAISNLVNNSSMSWDYQYHPNGQVKLASDIADNRFDRKYEYDPVGRLAEAYTGNEARGGSVSSPPNSPYRQSKTYDAFGNLTQMTGRIWQKTLTGFSFSYTNNRRSGLTFDAAGHVTADPQGTHAFDAQGQRSFVTTGTVGGGFTGNPEAPAQETSTVFDGAGHPAIVNSTSRSEELVGEGPQTTISTGSDTIYYLRSTVLESVIAELNASGQRTKEYVYASGELVAEWDITPWNDGITWQHKNFATGAWISVYAGFNDAVRTEVDPTGRVTGNEPFFIPPDPPPPPPTREPTYVIEGGPSIESQLAMQLYEDRYINQVFGSSAGPGKGNYSGQAWQDWQTNREFELMTGQRFLFGIDRMNANLPGSSYEWVDDFVDIDGGESWSQAADGSWTATATTISVNRGYFRLIPGAGSSAVASPTTVQNTQKVSDCVRALLEPYFPGLDLSQITIHNDGIPKVVEKFNTVPGGAGAVTWGYDIYYPANSFNPTTNEAIAAFAHEVVHVWQYSVLGKVGFSRQYAQSYIKNIKDQMPSLNLSYSGILLDTTGMQFAEFMRFQDAMKKLVPADVLQKAYRDIPLEQEAYTFEKEFFDYIKEIAKGSNKASPCP